MEEAEDFEKQAARDYFPAFGWAGPDEGWDAWEGPCDDST